MPVANGSLVPIAQFLTVTTTDGLAYRDDCKAIYFTMAMLELIATSGRIIIYPLMTK